ncbi:MAG: rodA [Parachlamydiales bacterium]|nr:rodA [Parachlamydiales bacterium]
MNRVVNYQCLSRIDWRIVPVIFALMIISLLVISSMTADAEDLFWTPLVKSQLRWFLCGWAVFAVMAVFDYRKLQSFSWILYGGIVVLLLGLYLTAPIQNVHRWYRIPVIGLNIQPSEHAKLIVAIALAHFLEKQGSYVGSLRVAMKAFAIMGLPFILILKQPDLGTALILFPISLAMCYFAGVHSKVIRAMTLAGIGGLLVVLFLFVGMFSHEEMRPFFTRFMKEYQYERLNPNTYHQKAAATSIAVGGLTGTGWKESEFAGKKWLPAAHTDSVFAAYGEEFGFVGLVILLLLFFALIYFSLQVAAVAKDAFGRILAAGLAVYLAMHVLLNISMMCALLPIAGVPLIFVTYGGNSILTTMAALGILQSIYSRRFMF